MIGSGNGESDLEQGGGVMSHPRPKAAMKELSRGPKRMTGSVRTSQERI